LVGWTGDQAAKDIDNEDESGDVEDAEDVGGQVW
jgi:hypothetical protein